MKSRPGYPEAARRISEIKREGEEPGHEITLQFVLAHKFDKDQDNNSSIQDAWIVDPTTVGYGGPLRNHPLQLPGAHLPHTCGHQQTGRSSEHNYFFQGFRLPATAIPL